MIISRLIFFAVTLSMSVTQCDKQQNVSVEKIEFSTLTRGYQKRITIREDSVITSVQGRGEDQVQKRITTKAEWDKLVDAVRTIDVSNVSALQSPSSKRSFDGAMHSLIRVVTKEGETYEHAFDDEEPHKDLRSFLRLILSME
ncbi:MAG TPA: hypothetical protein VD927_05000 [Chryseosolibacter sp.]|nr:hypothetical protein [Chryseosolibacter sp.]